MCGVGKKIPGHLELCDYRGHRGQGLFDEDKASFKVRTGVG